MHRWRLRPLIALLASILGSVSCAQRAASDRTYQLGEKVKLGHLVYSAFDTQWLTEIGQGLTARVPQQRFFLVRVAITNSGNHTIVAPNLSVVDDSGKSYEELSDGQGVNRWIGFLRQISASDTSQGNLLFDVPPRHYKLRILGEGGQQSALIDLPLDFSGDEMPDFELPTAGKKQ